MAWVIDSCVLLDVALNDPQWGLSSAQWLESKRPEGLVVCPVSVVEITPQFGGELKEVTKFLALLGVRDEHDWLHADTRTAALAWSEYVQHKRLRETPKRPVADILIGAFATRFGGLLTRNPDHFSLWFPGLALPRPEKQ
jgi:predicted nucleic acid-binding protein